MPIISHISVSLDFFVFALVFMPSSQALSARIWIRLYSQTFYWDYKTLRVYMYPGFLRFLLSACIRIRSEFGTQMFESLIEHALKNKLRQLTWQRFT